MAFRVLRSARLKARSIRQLPKQFELNLNGVRNPDLDVLVQEKPANLSGTRAAHTHETKMEKLAAITVLATFVVFTATYALMAWKMPSQKKRQTPPTRTG
jgi:hypothetical protein